MKRQENKGERPESLRPAHSSAEFSGRVSNNFDILKGKVDTVLQSILKPETDSSKTTRVTDRVLDVMPQSAAPMRRSNFHLEDAEVERLAIRAMDATRAMDTSDAATPFAQLFALADAYTDVEDASRHEILDSLLDHGVAAEKIADEIVPVIALYMGRLWEFDRISFAEVSIAAARLQETVRSLTVDRSAEEPTDTETRILLVAPAIETHTLGIFVLSEQFRRLGCTVHVCVGNSPREIVSLVRRTPFDMIGITAGSRRSLNSVREIVKELRAGVPRNNKIVLGGAVTQLDLDLKLATGVDYVSNGVDDALAKCGLEMQKSKANLL